MKIEVEDERLEASMTKAVRRVAQQVRIPGFRPGKAPRAIVERTVGRPALLQEALDLLLPDVYNEALESEAIDAIGQPEFELESMEPLVVNARVPVRPTIDLDDYRSLRAPRPEAEFRPEQVEDSLTELRRRYATLEPADRPVQWGDTVRCDVTVTVEGQGEPHTEEDAEFRVSQDAIVSLPGFLAHLIGLERGGPYDITFQLPEDFEAAALAGKTASYQLTLHEVKQEVLPELDDDFAKSLGEDFETVAQLRERVEREVREQSEAQVLASYQDEIIDLLVASAEIDYPQVLVEREVDRLLDQQSNHASHTPEELAQWLERVGRTEEEVRESLRDQADLNVRRALVLGEFVAREAVEVSDERVAEEVDKLVDNMVGGRELQGEQRERFRQIFDTPEGRQSLRERATTQLALERLVEICSQPEEEAAERPRRSRRRRGARGAGEAADASDVAGEGDGDEADAEASAEAAASEVPAAESPEAGQRE